MDGLGVGHREVCRGTVLADHEVGGDRDEGAGVVGLVGGSGHVL